MQGHLTGFPWALDSLIHHSIQKNSSARHRHPCVFLNSSCRQRCCVSSQDWSSQRPAALRCSEALGPGWQEGNAAGKQCVVALSGGFTILTSRSGWLEAAEAAPGEAGGPAASAGCWLEERSESTVFHQLFYMENCRSTISPLCTPEQ